MTWIKCSERLPAPATEDNVNYVLAYVDGADGGWMTITHTIQVDDCPVIWTIQRVTHWQPLPEPPPKENS